MTVVADTGSINYLYLIGHADILSALYGRVILPEAVFEELTRDKAPEIVRTTLLAKPDWLEVVNGTLFRVG